MIPSITMELHSSLDYNIIFSIYYFSSFNNLTILQQRFCNMLPPRLHGIHYNDIRKYHQSFKKLRSAMQDRLKFKWIANYHKYQRHIKCAFKAVDELAERLVFEAVTNLIDHRDIRDHFWYRYSKRDKGHQERIRRLVRTVRSSRKALDYSKCFVWLNIEQAYKN